MMSPAATVPVVLIVAATGTNSSLTSLTCADSVNGAYTTDAQLTPEGSAIISGRPAPPPILRGREQDDPLFSCRFGQGPVHPQAFARLDPLQAQRWRVLLNCELEVVSVHRGAMLESV